MAVISVVRSHKYEVLLFALLQHLFMGLVVGNLAVYARIIWPINIVVLGLASVAIFWDKHRWKQVLRTLLFVPVLLLPIGLPFLGYHPHYFLLLNAVYVAFFGLLFMEVLRFLVRPGYINSDLISAAACGYFLLIETAVFLLQFFQYANPASFRGMDTTNHTTVFIDLVYFCTITITSIGFGDITPATYHTKLITSLFGVTGQFYAVVLVGILISKFTAGKGHA